MKKKVVIAVSVIAAVAVILGSLLFIVSHAVYHRSVMATLAEMYMVLIDRDAIYESGNGYEENLELRSVENLKPHTPPKGVNPKIPYYDKNEHGMQVFYFNEDCFTDTILIYVPGGGYMNNPLKYHWQIIEKLSTATDTPVIMPVYLKVPNYTCEESFDAMIEFYLDVASRKNVKRIIMAGDSSGGGMTLALAQILRDDYPEVLQPDDLILIAPWMDVSMENEEIKKYEPIDPMLDISGAKDIGVRWADSRGVHDPMVSPIYGTFENLGDITMFIGTKDMLYPDIQKFSDILTEQNIEHTYVVKESLNHPYPLFPIPEAKEAQQIMIDVILNADK